MEGLLLLNVKGELRPEIFLLHMKVLTLIKAKSNVFLWYVQCCINMVCDCWFPCSCVYWSLVKARKIIWESQVIDSSSITQSEALWVWRCDVSTSNSIQDGDTQVVNILVFDLRVQLEHSTYQRKTLPFALIMISTFTYKGEISVFSSPLRIKVLSLCWQVK